MTGKLSHIKIIGHIKHIDAAIEKYIAKYNIQLEYATKAITNAKELSSTEVINPYARLFEMAVKVYKMTGLGEKSDHEVSKEGAIKIIESANDYMLSATKDLSEHKQRREDFAQVLNAVEPFIELDFKIEDIAKFSFLNYQFGKMPISSYKQFEKFLYKDSEIIFVKTKQEANYLWGVYFCMDTLKAKVDSILTSLHFQQIEFPTKLGDTDLTGTPKSVYEDIQLKLTDIDRQIQTSERLRMDEAHVDENTDINEKDIVSAYSKIQELYYSYETRKYAAETANNFFTFIGWMEGSKVADLDETIKNDQLVEFFAEESNSNTNSNGPIKSKPPAKIKNRFFIKSFVDFIGRKRTVRLKK